MKVSYELEMDQNEMTVLVNGLKDVIHLAADKAAQMDNNRIFSGLSNVANDLSRKLGNISFSLEAMKKVAERRERDKNYYCDDKKK